MLTPAHWVYLAGVLAVIISMAYRTNPVAPAMLGTFATAFAMTGSVPTALEALFLGPLTAARALFNIFLVIALMVALMNALQRLQADVRMVRPFQRVMKNGHTGFFVLASVSYVLSLFFWPTPSVPLIAGVLLPAAIYAGVRPMAAALCIAVAGLGSALSPDYVLKVGPGLTAKTAGVPMTDVADKGLILSIISGTVALTIVYLRVRKTMLVPGVENLQRWEDTEVSGTAAVSRPQRQIWNWGRALRFFSIRQAKKDEFALAFAPASVVISSDETFPTSSPEVPAAHAAPRVERPAAPKAPAVSLTSVQIAWSKIFAVLTPLAFLGIVVFMVLPRILPGFKGVGGDAAAALVGGVAALLMIFASAAFDYRSLCRSASERITEGFVFSFRAMSSMPIIAGFFFIGVGNLAGPIIGLPPGTHAPALLAELVQAGAQWIPHNSIFLSFGILISGMVTGIDGSGFAGLPLAGALAGALGRTAHENVSALAAVGQMGSVWTGKTLTGWSALAAVAGFARVPVLEAVRQLWLPVTLGLFAAAMFAALRTSKAVAF
jgi:hypothetical protein